MLEPQLPAGGGRRRLLRPREGRVLFGVAAGIGRKYGVDPTAIRIGFVLSALLGGLSLLVYLVLALFAPSDDGGEPVEHSIGDEVRYGLVLLTFAIIAFASWLGEELFWESGPKILFWPALLLSVAFAIAIAIAGWGTPAPGRDRTGRALAAVTLGALFGFGAVVLFTFALVTTALGEWFVALAAVAFVGIWFGLRAPTGRSRWLAAPLVILVVGAATPLIAGIEFDGGTGTATMGGGAKTFGNSPHELGAGQMIFDLRGGGWRRGGERSLQLSVGAGEGVVVVPESVCVAGQAEAAVGELDVFGSRSVGIGISRELGSPETTGSRVLRLTARVELGTIRVINSRFFRGYSSSDSRGGSESVNDRACRDAGPERP